MARASVEPQSAVIVGEVVRLRVEVLVPTFFRGAPQFPALDVPNTITIQPTGFAQNFAERIGAQSYAGQARTYEIYPMAAGTYTIPEIAVVVNYGLDAGGASGPVTLTPPPVELRARLPEEAVGLDHFIATSRLTLTQAFDRQPDTLKVGEALTRVITMTVDDSFAMFLPPLEVAPVPGLAVYPDPPRTSDEGGERGERRRGHRVESVTYVMQEEGAYRLPPAEVTWWDRNAQRLRTESLPAVEFSVVPNPELVEEFAVSEDAEEVLGGDPSTSRGRTPWLLQRGLLLAAAIVLLALLARWGRRRWPEWRSRWLAWNARRAHSEPAYFERFRNACRADDARAAMRELVAWLDRIEDRGRPATVDSMVIVAADPALTAEIEALEVAIFAKPGAAEIPRWSGSRLFAAVSRYRRKGRRRGPAVSRSSRLAPLNP